MEFNPTHTVTSLGSKWELDFKNRKFRRTPLNPPRKYESWDQDDYKIRPMGDLIIHNNTLMTEEHGEIANFRLNGWRCIPITIRERNKLQAAIKAAYS